MVWRILVDAKQDGWNGNWIKNLDSEDGAGWREAWDDIFTGYKAKRFLTEREADGAARRLRSRGFIVATEEVGDAFESARSNPT